MLSLALTGNCLLLPDSIGGIKQKQKERLLKYEQRKTLADSPATRISKFLEPTGHVQSGEKPFITQYYAETFNKVDMFNRLHSEIQYKFRCG